MGQQKFEKDFREKLYNRELNPSAGSWDKLEAKLEAGRERKNYRYWWIGIAASIAGAIFILTQFYFDSAEPVSPGIVEIPVEAEETGEVPGVREIPVVEEMVVAAKEIEEPLKTSGTEKQKKTTVPTTTTDVIAVTEKQEERLKEIHTQEPSPAIEEDAIAAKLQEVVAAVTLKEESGAVTDAEIDALLNKAATELEQRHTPKRAVANVDYEALLWEVEMELERSFREKVLDILKEGYMKTRTAVANRNF